MPCGLDCGTRWQTVDAEAGQFRDEDICLYSHNGDSCTDYDEQDPQALTQMNKLGSLRDPADR